MFEVSEVHGKMRLGVVKFVFNAPEIQSKIRVDADEARNEK